MVNLTKYLKPKKCLSTRGRQSKAEFHPCCGMAGLHRISCRHGQTAERNGRKGGAIVAALAGLARLGPEGVEA